MEDDELPAGTRWHRLTDLPDEGRVIIAVVDGRSVALTRCDGKLGALANRCPHQGGPLGEGSDGCAALGTVMTTTPPLGPTGGLHRCARSVPRARGRSTQLDGVA